MNPSTEDMTISHIYKGNIFDKETKKTTFFSILKRSDKSLWLSERVELKIAENFLGNDSYKEVLKDPKTANDIKGIKADDGKGVDFKREGKEVIVTTFLQTYGESWRKDAVYNIEADLFDSFLKVALNKKVVDEVLASERGPKSVANFGN